MLISPPFLPVRTVGLSDADFVASAMQPAATNCAGTSVPEGSFPISLKLGWHGGTHLAAPAASQIVLPVRCIADGEIVYARRPTKMNDEASHALNYNPYGSGPTWTDDGMVIIRHITATGNGNNASDIEFYTLICHLSELSGNFLRVANGTATEEQRKVLRKDLVGVAGRVYATASHVHLEILCDQQNLQKLIGRTTGRLQVTEDGRTDAIYGDIYYHLPIGTKFYRDQPVDTVTLPPVDATHTSSESIFVGISYAEGNGSHPGHAMLTSYSTEGSLIGETPVQEAEAEYRLLNRASALVTTFSAAHSPQIPITAAVYELLRFGRVIGPDTLSPANISHWRQVNYAGGIGWVNLNERGIFKFSDADFPHWRGWTLIDDDLDDNSQCNSASLIAKIEEASNSDGSLSRQELESRMSLPGVRALLSKTICKFPSEWNRDTIDVRWGWIRTDPQFGLQGEDWDLFKAHVSALTVAAADLPPALREAHWHFHPQFFIEHLRKCSWLSETELAQTLPRYMFYNDHGNPRTAITTDSPTYSLTREAATARLAAHYLPLNQCIRKYIGASRQRVAIFLAQVILETAQWRNPGGMRRLMHEWFYGQYSAANPATEFYTAFYGRGIMQLTWAGNYRDYGEYRKLANHNGNYVERLPNVARRINANSSHYLANPSDVGVTIVWSPRYDPDYIAENPYAACDSGGYYWVSKHFSGNTNINRACDQAFTPSIVGLVNRLVNGGGNGYYERQAYAAFLMRLLTEDVATDSTRTIALPPPKNSITVNFGRT